MGIENQKKDMLLIQKIRLEKDQEAKNTLVNKYLPMVRHIVRQHPHNPLDQEDLIQEGLIGLLKAIHEYKPDAYPVKFSTFAYICILRRVFNTLKLWHSKKYRVLSCAISLQLNLRFDETRTLIDTIEQPGNNPQEIVEDYWTDSRLSQVLQAYLSPVELAVIESYLQGMASSEIQRKLGLSAKIVDNARTRVRQKLMRIVKKYGSLVSPSIPLKTRKRADLTLSLRKLG